ncbi:hypothetical protein K439DRAFT_1623002 [Ramaria rubella]|nr:hypothetical protein K439DRAFT_1623002 [Ramaria rubella]
MLCPLVYTRSGGVFDWKRDTPVLRTLRAHSHSHPPSHPYARHPRQVRQDHGSLPTGGSFGRPACLHTLTPRPTRTRMVRAAGSVRTRSARRLNGPYGEGVAGCDGGCAGGRNGAGVRGGVRGREGDMTRGFVGGGNGTPVRERWCVCDKQREQLGGERRRQEGDEGGVRRWGCVGGDEGDRGGVGVIRGETGWLEAAGGVWVAGTAQEGDEGWHGVTRGGMGRSWVVWGGGGVWVKEAAEWVPEGGNGAEEGRRRPLRRATSA